MVAVEEVLTDSLGKCVRAWFSPSLDHPFLNLQTIVVPDNVKSIPHRWVDDVEVQIDEGFGLEDGDILGEGPVTGWSGDEGKTRLRNALARLDISEDHMGQSNLARMGLRDLSNEKRRVKQELKRYDAEFRKQFTRLPTHMEKEPMRPLYVYYRRLKTMISQMEQGRQGRIRESLSTIPDTDETPRDRAVPRRSNTVEDQMASLEARLETLQNEKSSVRTKLQAFQEKFVVENSRKLRFHKDILPIEREYRMYKNLKEEIAKVESQLRELKSVV